MWNALQFNQLVGLEVQEERLGAEASREAGQLSVGADDTVAWSHYGDRVPCVCNTHGAGLAGLSNLIRYGAVGPGFARWDCQERVPHPFLEIGANEVQW